MMINGGEKGVDDPWERRREERRRIAESLEGLYEPQASAVEKEERERRRRHQDRRTSYED